MSGQIILLHYDVFGVIPKFWNLQPVYFDPFILVGRINEIYQR